MSLPAATPPIVAEAARVAGPLLQHDSDASGWPVLVMLAALVGGDQELWELLEAPGLVEALAPETAGEAWLTFAAAINGGQLAESMTLAQRRVEARHPSGWALGMGSTIRAQIAELLTTGAAPWFLPRSSPTDPGDQPDDFTLIVPPSMLAGDVGAELYRRVAAQMIEGDHAHVLIGTRVADEASHHATVAARAQAHATVANAARGH